MSIDKMNMHNVTIAARLMTRQRPRHLFRRFPIRFILFGQVAWVGLALVLTAGFGIALRLFAGRSALDPGPLHACALFFVWCMILLGSTSNA
jgi:hypothetical protein